MGARRSLPDREAKRTEGRADVHSATLLRYGIGTIAVCDAACIGSGRPKHIVFGSDFPYVHGDVLDFEIQQLDQLDVFDKATRSMVARQNALELFPRFAPKTAAAK